MIDDIEEIKDDKLLDAFTNDEYKMYVNSLSIYPTLTVLEQKELFRKGEIQRLINCTLKLVVKVASSYKDRICNLNILDIIQEGNMGLLYAVKKYDPEKGAFTTYAMPWIKQRIYKAIVDKEKFIRIPNHMDELVNRYYRLLNDFNKEGKIPSKEEIMNYLKIDERKYKTLMFTLSEYVLSLNQKVGKETDDELGNIIPDGNSNDYNEIDDTMVDYDLKLVLKQILSKAEYFIIYYRYLSNEERTLEWLASCFDVTIEGIRVKIKLALNKIKPYMEKNSKEYIQVLNSINNKSIYKILPIEPKDIIKYLYIKDVLSEKELKLYYLIFLSDINYSNDEYIKILEISKHELKEMIKSIQLKIEEKFKNKEDFQEFKNKTIKEYGTSIYNVITEKDNNKKSSKRVNRNIANNSLDFILNNKSFDMMIFLKQVLSKLQYYLIYNRYLSDNPKDNEFLALELHINFESVPAYIYAILRDLNAYFIDDGKEYYNVINNIKNNYGLDYYFLKEEPITPKDILKYLYLKRDLNLMEKRLYELDNFGLFKYSIYDYARFMNLSIEEVNILKESVENKIKNKFSNLAKFEYYVDLVMEAQKGFIYRSITIGIPIMNIEQFLAKYSLLNIDEIKNLFINIGYNLTLEEENLLKYLINCYQNKMQLEKESLYEGEQLLQMLDLKLTYKNK